MAEKEEGIIIPHVLHTGPATITSDDIVIDKQHAGFSFFIVADQQIDLFLDLFMFGAWRVDWDELTTVMPQGTIIQWKFADNKIPDDVPDENVRARVRMVLNQDTTGGIYLSLHNKRK